MMDVSLGNILLSFTASVELSGMSRTVTALLSMEPLLPIADGWSYHGVVKCPKQLPANSWGPQPQVEVWILVVKLVRGTQKPLDMGYAPLLCMTMVVLSPLFQTSCLLWPIQYFLVAVLKCLMIPVVQLNHGLLSRGVGSPVLSHACVEQLFGFSNVQVCAFFTALDNIHSILCFHPICFVCFG